VRQGVCGEQQTEATPTRTHGRKTFPGIPSFNQQTKSLFCQSNWVQPSVAC